MNSTTVSPQPAAINLSGNQTTANPHSVSNQEGTKEVRICLPATSKHRANPQKISNSTKAPINPPRIPPTPLSRPVPEVTTPPLLALAPQKSKLPPPKIASVTSIRPHQKTPTRHQARHTKSSWLATSPKHPNHAIGEWMRKCDIPGPRIESPAVPVESVFGRML
jgi:hypothetical protein